MRKPKRPDVLDSLKVQILSAQPGDVVVLTSDRTMTQEHVDAILRAWRAIPTMEGVSVAVLDRGMRLDGVVRPDSRPEPSPDVPNPMRRR